MAVRKPLINEPGIYFITFTCYRWLQLFAITDAYDLIYKWFDYLKKEKQYVVAYVIMPNHIHLLLAYNHSKTLNSILGNGKRFLAYDIIEKLNQIPATETLEQLRYGVNKSDADRNKLHEVFEESFDAKICFSKDFLLQKLNYIHNNPCSKNWMLAADPASYPHSSALYYYTGTHSKYCVNSWAELYMNGISASEP